jgi:hypothetical protein
MGYQWPWKARMDKGMEGADSGLLNRLLYRSPCSATLLKECHFVKRGMPFSRTFVFIFSVLQKLPPLCCLTKIAGISKRSQTLHIQAGLLEDYQAFHLCAERVPNGVKVACRLQILPIDERGITRRRFARSRTCCCQTTGEVL